MAPTSRNWRRRKHINSVKWISNKIFRSPTLHITCFTYEKQSDDYEIVLEQTLGSMWQYRVIFVDSIRNWFYLYDFYQSYDFPYDSNSF